MSLKEVCEELDELAVNYFQTLEELSEQRRRFEKFIKEVRFFCHKLQNVTPWKYKS